MQPNSGVGPNPAILIPKIGTVHVGMLSFREEPEVLADLSGTVRSQSFCWDWGRGE